jgi:hypothetical protein
MYKGVALVRDKDGNPKIDGDPRNLPPEIQLMLTEEERSNLGLPVPKRKES